MKFEEFLQQKHAEQYKGTDDDMEEDYERWIMELEIEQIIQFAEKWHDIEMRNKYREAFDNLFGLRLKEQE